MKCILKSLNDLIWFDGLIFTIFMHFIRSHPLAKKSFLNLVVLREGEIKETLLKCLKMIEVNAATLVVRRKKRKIPQNSLDNVYLFSYLYVRLS